MRQNSFVFLLAVISCTLPGCYKSVPTQQYLTVTRSTAPQPVYNRIFIARPPEVLPSNKVSKVGSIPVDPIYQLEAQNQTIEQIAKQLGNAARYRSYTAASVADKKISVESLGTIDELADTIGSIGGVYVSVDHANRELRVLPPRKQRS